MSFYKGVPLEFNFEFLGIIYDSIYLHEDGFAAFVSENSVYDSWISLFDCDLKNYQNNPTLSPIIYKTEGSPGNKIFKCEYASVGFENDSENNDSINFQLWLYEECNVFEIHIGPGSIEPSETDLFYNNESSPFIGYGDRSPFSPWHLAGDPLAPSQDPDPWDVLDTIPNEGSTFRFYDCVAGIQEVKNIISIYPNPTTDYITINFNGSTQYSRYNIMDVSAQLVMSNSITENETLTIGVEGLENGIYFIQLEDGTNSKTFKFVRK